VTDSWASVGGGAFPSAAIPSAALVISGDAAARESRLRDGDPPVIGRIESGRLLLDLRSVPEADDQALADAIIAALR
nr:L-seryl-tRNA(Sec) selenium transferase [Gemmatimonadaceae bacterium]